MNQQKLFRFLNLLFFFNRKVSIFNKSLCDFVLWLILVLSRILRIFHSMLSRLLSYRRTALRRMTILFYLLMCAIQSTCIMFIQVCRLLQNGCESIKISESCGIIRNIMSLGTQRLIEYTLTSCTGRHAPGLSKIWLDIPMKFRLALYHRCFCH